MSAQKPDPMDRTSGFGPNRHRMEIELMEKRFRERSERRAGAQVSTGEIDGKVSDEMRQFFDASAQTLSKVVPSLQQNDQRRTMIETTGEIRRKVDEFFSEGTAAAPAPAAPAPRRAAPPPQRAAAPTRFDAPVAALRAPAPSAPPAEPQRPTTVGEAPMDLKSALEKLRRHGVAKGSATARAESVRASAAPAAQRQAVSLPATAPALAPSPPAVVREVVREPSPAPRASMAAPAPAPAVRPAPRADSGLPRVDAPAPRGAVAPSGAPPLRAAPGGGPRVTGAPAPRPRPVKNPTAAGVTPLPPRPKPKSPGDRPRPITELPPISTEAVVPAAPEPTIRSHRPISRPITPGSVQAALPSAPAPRAAVQPAASPEPAEPAPRTGGEVSDAKFDAIFDEVQGIVLDTLKVSVDETFDAARKAEPELAEVAAPTLRDPLSGPITPSAVRPKLPTPRDDDDEEVAVADEPAPAGPHDWGVKRAPRPKGAWLLDTPEPKSAEPSPRTVTGDVGLPAAPAPAAGGGGARAYLLRKAGDEVRKFQPVLAALEKQKLVEPERAEAKAAGGDDEFVSADSFKDSRPSPAEIEAELSPMRLVEELRRLKRVTQALIDKGVISAEDLAKAQGD